jgi:hypothetical protein
LSGISNSIKLTYEESHKEIDGVVHKLCYNCNEWFPMTLEYFYGNKSKEGLSPWCKTCAKLKSSKNQKENNIRYHREQRKFKDAHKSYDRDRNKIYRAIPENREKLVERYRMFTVNNPEKMKGYRENRERNKKHTIPKKQWDACKTYFGNTCAYCGLLIEDHWVVYNGITKNGDFHKEHVDHNGENDLSNCIPSCKSCNSLKWKFELSYWYNEDNPIYSIERLDKINKWLTEDYKLYI